MKVMLIKSGSFIKKAKKLIKRNPKITQDLQATLKTLSEDPFHPSLKTHKLKGELFEFWACSINYDLRIIFKFIQHEDMQSVLLSSIGTHDEVY